MAAELMKGKVFVDRKHLLQYPVIAEIKYDEIRVHVKLDPLNGSGEVVFLSYAGLPLYNLDPFAAQFYDFFVKSGLTELDCGLEVNGNFNDSYRWVRSSTGIPKAKLDKKTGKAAPALNLGMVRWILFDLPENTAKYSDRRNDVYCVAHDLREVWKLPIEVPESVECDNVLEVETYFESVRDRGFEGLMVKTPQHTYQKGKRIDGWLKMKPSGNADGVITGINEAISEDGTPLGRAGSVTLLLEDGTSASPHGINHHLGRDMYRDPAYYIGQWVEFDYMEIDRKGGYRHPTFKRLREAK